MREEKVICFDTLHFLDAEFVFEFINFCMSKTLSDIVMEFISSPFPPVWYQEGGQQECEGRR